jgi:hypothetical protein
MIDELIKVLERVKNCSLALDKLKEAGNNKLFMDPVFNDGKQMWVNHVGKLIDEAIMLIQDGADYDNNCKERPETPMEKR